MKVETLRQILAMAQISDAEITLQDARGNEIDIKNIDFGVDTHGNICNIYLNLKKD